MMQKRVKTTKSKFYESVDPLVNPVWILCVYTFKYNTRFTGKTDVSWRKEFSRDVLRNAISTYTWRADFLHCNALK